MSASPHVLVIYNEPLLPADHPDAASEREILDVAALVAQDLAAAGYRVTRLGLGLDPSPLVEQGKRDRPDAVFNLFEGFSDGKPAEIYPLAILDWLGVPYTGNGVEALVLCRDKPRAKTLLQGAGLPTPRFAAVHRTNDLKVDVGWPAILKPASQDASIGIDQGSVVRNAAALEARAEWLAARYGLPILVEEYIAGRELSVAVIADPTPRCLPVSEIVFHHTDSGRWPIVTYDAKWAEGSFEDEATRPQCPADIPNAWRGQLQELALRAFQLFSCRDFVRVDFRVRQDGQPYILELNPNPGYHPTAGFARALAAAGISYAEHSVAMVRRLIR